MSLGAPGAPRPCRRVFLACGTVLAGLCSFPQLTLAEEALVPISLQVELLLKVAAYDKNLPQRAAGRLGVTVLVKKDDPDSVRSAAQARLALSKTPEVLGLPLESSSLTYSDAAALAQLLRSTRAAILYVMPGFTESELAAMAEACAGISVLSVGALARHAERGTVLALDLVGGKPKLIVHLTRARQQHVDLSSNVLKLMRVIE